MDELAIKRHKFDLAKDRLKKFSDKTAAELKIDKVQTEGFLGVFDHKVTGDEFNDRLETIQEHFIAFNKTNKKVIKEFREVYHTIDWLDKEYITSIVALVKSIEKTSNDVRVQQEILKQHNDKLANQQSKLDEHQTEIEKNVENISKVVTTLKVFKEKLENYKHLADIDKIWNELQEWNNEINTLSESIEYANEHSKESSEIANEVKAKLTIVEKEIEDLSDQSSDLIERLESVIAYTKALEQINHLENVDSMWEDIELHKTQLTELKKQDEELVDAIQKNKEEADAKIEDSVQKTSIAVENLTKRIKYAYWIAGGSAGLAIIELILLLMKVI